MEVYLIYTYLHDHAQTITHPSGYWAENCSRFFTIVLYMEFGYQLKLNPLFPSYLGLLPNARLKIGAQLLQIAFILSMICRRKLNGLCV